jgi:formylglycine-generating enzyme required for sulfatase activity
MKKHIFISYAWADAKDFAWQLGDALLAEGFMVWLDRDENPDGAEWYKNLQQALKNTGVFLALRSPAAQTTAKWVPEERLYAIKNIHHIIPVIVKDCEDDLGLMGRGPVDASADPAGAIQKIVARLRQILTEGAAPTLSPRLLEEEYLAAVLREHQDWAEKYTPMAGDARLRLAHEADEDEEDEIQTSPAALRAIYDALAKRLPHEESRLIETQTRVYEDNILGAIADMQQLVVMGDPGAGKSTSLWRVAYETAGAALSDPAAPLPLLIRFGDLGGRSLRQGLAAQLGEKLAPYYDSLLEAGRLVFLLDGLNELEGRDRDHRAAILKELKALVKDCQARGRVVVITCRKLDYQGDLDLNIPEQVEIRPLDPPRIEQFIAHYFRKKPAAAEKLFWELAGGAAKRYWGSLQKGLNGDWAAFWLAKEKPAGVRYDWEWSAWLRERAQPRSLMGLAANPYMLFMMTGVFRRFKHLPQNRGRLFGAFVETLLEEREKLSPAQSQELQTALAALAYALQTEAASTGFTEARALDFLRETQLYQARSANLLTMGEPLSFTHQLLREYFAARHLDLQRLAGKPASDIWRPEAWWKPTGWEETAILLAGLYNDDCSPVIDWLADAQPDLAARCIVESGAAFPEGGYGALRERWLPRLRDIKTYPRAQDRAGFGRALERIDYDTLTNKRPRPLLDNRRGVGVVDGLPDIDWMLIPAGEFIYGEGETEQKLSLPAFGLARYPITYAQFQCFAADPAVYGDPRWWEGLAATEDQKRLYGQYFKYANHPREMVNWYQAIAFCRWLSFQLWAVGTRHVVSAADYDPMNPMTWLVRLPTEQEWEKAARGPHGLIYPYGNDFDAQKGNSGGTGIGLTSAVGVFPDGASPYGVEEMSGNVWEWCLNTYQGSINVNGADVRRLRGGSWVNSNTQLLRAPNRSRDNPYLVLNYRGFRCAASLLTS